jgi:ABC-type amino acid transport substrate-binding protein
MATDLENVESLFNPKNNGKSQSDLKFEAIANALKQLATQQQRASGVLDQVSEALSTMLYCLQNGELTFDSFQKAFPEVQASKFDAVLKNMFEGKVASQLSEVEVGSNVSVTGWEGENKKTLRRTFSVTDTENQAFVGKKVGDRVKVNPDDSEDFEILVIYKIGQFDVQ